MYVVIKSDDPDRLEALSAHPSVLKVVIEKFGVAEEKRLHADLHSGSLTRMRSVDSLLSANSQASLQMDRVSPLNGAINGRSAPKMQRLKKCLLFPLPYFFSTYYLLIVSAAWRRSM